MEFSLETLQNLFSDTKALVFGESALDIFLKGNPSGICQEAPVLTLDIQSESFSTGCAANTAFNAALLGGDIYFLSVIGKDKNGDRLSEILSRQGVNIGCLIRDFNSPTEEKNRLFSGTQLISRFDRKTSLTLSNWTENCLLENLTSLYPSQDAIVVSDYSNGLLSDNIICLLETLQQRYNLVLIVDSPRYQKFLSVQATVLKSNYDEFIRFLDLPIQEGEERLEQVESSGETILEASNASNLVITLGEQGAFLFTLKGEKIRFLSRPNSNLYAIGAGDIFSAMLALSLASGKNIKEACYWANEVSSKVVHNNDKVRTCDVRFLAAPKHTVNKVLTSREDLKRIVDHHRIKGSIIVFTNGCFDIVHAGHVSILEQAKTLGDVLIVGINTDESIQQIKGLGRPVNSLENRLKVISSFGCVDYVIPFSELDPCNLIKKFKPDICVKGGDYYPQNMPETKIVHEYGGTIKILPYVSNLSTSNLIDKIEALDITHNTFHESLP